jgi:DNA-binding SARP family transcriptional activator
MNTKQLIIAAFLIFAASNTVWATEEKHNKNEIDFNNKPSAKQILSLHTLNHEEGAEVACLCQSDATDRCVCDGAPPPQNRGYNANEMAALVGIIAQLMEICRSQLAWEIFIAVLLSILTPVRFYRLLKKLIRTKPRTSAVTSTLPVGELVNTAASEHADTIMTNEDSKDVPITDVTSNDATVTDAPSNDVLITDVTSNDVASAPAYAIENTPAEEHGFDCSRSFISLLDSFSVLDSEGDDITASFTPMQHDILIAIILYTVDEGKGISVKELTEIFWFDKNDYNARKNRNAYLRKIRNNLKRVGNVQIKLQNDHFRIFFGSGTACDYHALWTLAEEHKRDGLGGDSALIGLMEALLMRGPLLPNDEMPWMDKFKGTYSSKCTDLLKPMLKRADRNDDSDGAKHIGNIILRHDPLNEDVLIVWCTMLTRHGKYSIAKKLFDRFCRIYRQSMGEEYKKPFPIYIN